MVAEILSAFVENLAPLYLLTLFVGTAVGILTGALPGVTGVTGIALMLPFTFGMEPSQGLVMLAAVYMSAEFAGSIPAILLNTPGTTGSAATTLDGYPMTLQGKASVALYLQLFAGVVGGGIGALILLFFTPVLAQWSLLLGPLEIFWLAVAGVSLVALLTGKNILRGLIGVGLGALLTIPGQDAMTGVARFTFGHRELFGGIDVIPALLGLFAVANILLLLDRPTARVAPLEIRAGAWRVALGHLRKMKRLLGWSGLLGTLVGIVPGAGASVSAFVAYAEAKRLSKHPEQFGHGAPEGVAAPEAANNAQIGGIMIPLLGLGIPGSASAAVLFGALTVHGILPGPRLFDDRADIAYTFMVGLGFTVVAMLIVGLATIRWSSLVVRTPVRFLVPTVLVLAMIGTYGLRNSTFDVLVLIVVGIVGYFLARLDISIVAMALGLVLGGIIERNFQRAMVVGGAREGGFFAYSATRPIALILMLLTFAVLASGIVGIMRDRRQAKAEAAAGDDAPSPDTSTSDEGPDRTEGDR